MFDESRCMGFGDCISVSGGAISIQEGRIFINRESIPDSMPYADICPSRALSVTGNCQSISQILKEIEKDEPFYRSSGGGVTLTGGEPFMQDDWMYDLVTELKKMKIPVAVETCLHFQTNKLFRFIPFISEFLVDLKHVDKQKFRSFTGGNLDLVIKNIEWLDHQGASYRLRIPIIPLFNTTIEEMKRIINFSLTLDHCQQIDFIPYHRLGESKYRMLDRNYPFRDVLPVKDTEMESYMLYASENGLNVTIGG
jgi:pyruvate formate lyase activating enzyme